MPILVVVTFGGLSFVPLLALKMKKDFSEIAGWVGPTKKGMGVTGVGPRY